MSGRDRAMSCLLQCSNVNCIHPPISPVDCFGSFFACLRFLLSLSHCGIFLWLTHPIVIRKERKGKEDRSEGPGKNTVSRGERNRFDSKRNETLTNKPPYHTKQERIRRVGSTRVRMYGLMVTPHDPSSLFFPLASRFFSNRTLIAAPYHTATRYTPSSVPLLPNSYHTHSIFSSSSHVSRPQFVRLGASGRLGFRFAGPCRYTSKL